MIKTPVAFVVFNRPETTALVFEEIRRVKPPLLLIVADGPRRNVTGEAERCGEARAIAEKVDWQCEVRKNYSETNLGCRKRVSSGVDWIFREVEEAIILEDDCLPDPSFFRFCEELLEKYREDNRVGHINGTNFQFGKDVSPYSYYFSRYYQVWGWASWRRAWKGYDVEMKLWPEMRRGSWLKEMLGDGRFVPYWRYIFDRVYGGSIDTWDYQWFFYLWIQKRLGIVPSVNLVSNLGFGSGSTNTKGHNKFGNMDRRSMPFPLNHPPEVRRDEDADFFVETDRHFVKAPLFNMLLYLLRGKLNMNYPRSSGKGAPKGFLLDSSLMLTIFSCPKPMRGHIAVTQWNAIKSWTMLSPKPEVILLGDEEGVSETARELNVRHIPVVTCSEFGTPLVNSLFRYCTEGCP